MGYLTRLDIITSIIQSCILVVLITKTVKLTIDSRTCILPFFFALAMCGYLLSSLYWIAYDLLKPDSQMPMACNEIGECATILLLCASLETILKDKKKVASEIAFVLLFIGANIAFWIAWSGEWFQDILFGVPYIYFFWLLIRGLISRGTLSRKELWLTATSGFIILAMQIPLLTIKGIVFEFLKTTCFTIMLALAAWLGILSFRRKEFFLASTFFLWTELSMFLSVGYFYYLLFLANTIALPIMYSSMKKELINDG